MFGIFDNQLALPQHNKIIQLRDINIIKEELLNLQLLDGCRYNNGIEISNRKEIQSFHQVACAKHGDFIVIYRVQYI